MSAQPALRARLMDIHETESIMEQFKVERAFAFMTGRRLQRRYRGVYTKYSFWTQLATWAMVIYALVVLGFIAIDSSSADDQKTSASNAAFYMAITFFVVYILVRVALIVRWLLYWVIVAELLTYLATGNIHALFYAHGDEITSAESTRRHWIMVGLIVVEALTIAVYLFTHFTYPWLVKKDILNVSKWWSIKPGNQTNTFTYRSNARFYTTERNTVKYCGGVNSEGQPHGYGMWSDTAYHGERLTGQWENGIPIGPFRSFEHGSGYSFVNLRIGFCHNRAEPKSNGIWFWPKHSKDGLHWGVATVECSVSGGFFTFLPTVTHVTPFNSSDAPQNAAEVLPYLRTPSDNVVFTHKAEKESRQLSLRTKRQIFRESSTPTLNLSSPSLDTGKEALILLHGYNCSLDYGLNRLAQLLALGDFPSHIHPFVFSWPSGGVLAYFQAKSVGSESERTADDFDAFLRSLADARYTSINIIAHSMGARIYFNSLNRGSLDDILMKAGEPASGHPNEHGPKKMRLSTLTFANPDYSRDDFVKYGGGYDLSRRFCNHITLYADNMDGALYYLEFLSKKSLCGSLNYSLGKRGYMMHRDGSEDDLSEGSAAAFRQWQDRNASGLLDMDLAVALVNQQGHFPGVTSFAYNRDLPNGRSGAGEQEAPRQYLDMDVIDTTWMDNNVHAIRHNYFNLNPTVVDDLRHLVVSKKRARLRPGLLQTTAAENVYIFLVAPSHVKNK